MVQDGKFRSIFNEELDGSPCLWAFLNLVKEDKRLVRDKRGTSIGGEGRNDSVCVQTATEDVSCIWIFQEVQLKKVLVLLPGKLPNDPQVLPVWRAPVTSKALLSSAP